jgi:polar amino acid transport system substrate-binding protein
MRASLRGWGGVGAMAVGCALALAFVLLLPLTQSAGGSGTDGARGGPGLATAGPAKADSCVDSQAQNETWSPSGADGTTIDAIKARTGAKRKLIVGIDQNSYRWGYRNPNNSGAELEGFDIDLVHRIAQDILGDPDAVQFKAIPTSQRIPAVQDGRVDMVVRTMTINCDRLKDVAFSTAYFKAGQQLLVPDGSAITGYDDSLRGKTVCTAKGSTGETKLTGTAQGASRSDAQKFGAKVMTVDNQLDCLVRVQLGLADAVFTDNALAAGQAAQDPSMHLVGSPVTSEPYGVAMNRSDEDSDLVRRVNRVLEAYRAGGANSPWMASYDKWLAADLPGISGPPAPLYK